MKKINAAVVGLGKAGSTFDNENRDVVWSHVGAYLFLNEKYNLVAGVDIDNSSRENFEKRCPGITSYINLSNMIENHVFCVKTFRT